MFIYSSIRLETKSIKLQDFDLQFFRSLPILTLLNLKLFSGLISLVFLLEKVFTWLVEVTLPTTI